MSSSNKTSAQRATSGAARKVKERKNDILDGKHAVINDQTKGRKEKDRNDLLCNVRDQ